MSGTHKEVFNNLRDAHTGKVVETEILIDENLEGYLISSFERQYIAQQLARKTLAIIHSEE